MHHAVKLRSGANSPPSDAVETAERDQVGPARPQVLFIAHRVPYPPDRGDRIRSFHLLKFLAARADVCLAFLSDHAVPDETMSVLRRYCRRVADVRLDRRLRWLGAARSMALGRTATEGLFGSRRLKHIVRDWSANTRFDAVFAFCSSVAQYLDAPALAGVPTVIDLVDVDSQKWFDYAEHSRGPRQKVFRLEGKRLRRLEASLSNRAAAITLVSPQEARLYRSFCPAEHVYVIQNGVDLEYFAPQETSAGSAADHCVFVGALDYEANLDGVTWFCQEIWPRVRQRCPHMVFRLVGSNPGTAARRLATLPGVELVGEVPDVRPYLSDAAIALVPLRIARGLQNKVLEAMAMGKPVVVTPQALEGIGATPGVHVTQAATPDEWVEAMVNLISYPDHRNRLGLAARAFVEQQFLWKNQLEPLVALPGFSGCLQQTEADAPQPLGKPV
ncbi:MAG: TIGR03087 family PEP-CTERM/XrtA system glycosyltransferase [Pirellulales bacterium]|nr:TIGR03087 family PEP-CTERM/XrtA system glycosyltransferase [Pirellulales bacterium]